MYSVILRFDCFAVRRAVPKLKHAQNRNRILNLTRCAARRRVASHSMMSTTTAATADSKIASHAPLLDAPPSSSDEFARDWAEFTAGASSAFDALSSQATSALRSVRAHARESSTAFARSASSAAESTSGALRALSAERVAWFCAFASASTFFYTLAFIIGAPTLALAPAKFGLCFSVASGLSIASVGALRGASGQVAHMLSEERLAASACVAVSWMMTLRAAMWNHAYAGTVFWSVCQFLSVAYYQVSYFPYGVQGVKTVASVAFGLAGPACSGCLRAFGYEGGGITASQRGLGVLPV